MEDSSQVHRPNTVFDDLYFSGDKTSLFTHAICMLLYLQYQYEVHNKPIKIISSDLVSQHSNEVSRFKLKEKTILDNIRSMENLNLILTKKEEKYKYLEVFSETQYSSIFGSSNTTNLGFLLQFSIGQFGSHYKFISEENKTEFHNLVSTTKFWQLVRELHEHSLKIDEQFNNDPSEKDQHETKLDFLINYKKLKGLSCLQIGSNLEEIITKQEFIYFLDIYYNYYRIVEIILSN